jgi:hypothetical protein
MKREMSVIGLFAAVQLTSTALLAAEISGFVGHSSMQAAPNMSVKLMKGESAQVVDIDETNFFGKYRFKNVAPGYYKLQVGELTRELMIKDTSEQKRLDIDLSAAGGAMDYARGWQEELLNQMAGKGSTPTTPSTEAAAGPNDLELAGQIAGVWWGYAGSTERRIGLCPGGGYRDYTESGYSGSSYDAYGSQNMAWGTASQRGGQGSWTIQGNSQSGVISVRYNSGKTTTLNYRQINDPGCLDINGNRLCRTSAKCE